MLRPMQRGDTIIEVLLAVTVFSLVAVGAMTVMNQGTNSAQRALEISLVKQQIDAQAEALRTVQQDYFAAASGDADLGEQGEEWEQITGSGVGEDDIRVEGSRCPANYGDAFAMNARTARFVPSSQLKSMENETAPPYAQVTYRSTRPVEDGNADQNDVTGVYGLWIQKRVRTDFTPRAYDFTIHACWYGPGTDVPMQLQTTVRLYDSN